MYLCSCQCSWIFDGTRDNYKYSRIKRWKCWVVPRQDNPASMKHFIWCFDHLSPRQGLARESSPVAMGELVPFRPGKHRTVKQEHPRFILKVAGMLGGSRRSCFYGEEHHLRKLVDSTTPSVLSFGFSRLLWTYPSIHSLVLLSLRFQPTLIYNLFFQVWEKSYSAPCVDSPCTDRSITDDHHYSTDGG